MNSRHRPSFSGSVCLAICGALVVAAVQAGCQKGDPLEIKVGAASAISFQQWRAELGDRLTADQLRDIDTAVQELRFKIMGEGTSGTEAVFAALQERVAGKTVRQLVELGLVARLERLEKDRATLATFITQNASLVTRDGDTASADYLARKREDQLARLTALDRDIQETRNRMMAFGLKPPPVSPHAPIPDHGSPSIEEHPDVMPEIVRPERK